MHVILLYVNGKHLALWLALRCLTDQEIFTDIFKIFLEKRASLRLIEHNDCVVL